MTRSLQLVHMTTYPKHGVFELGYTFIHDAVAKYAQYFSDKFEYYAILQRKCHALACTSHIQGALTTHLTGWLAKLTFVRVIDCC